MEKTIQSKVVYEGNIIKIRSDEVQLENGSVVTRDLVQHPGGVCIALEMKDNTFLLVDQYRYGVSKNVLEFPAGKLEKGENHRNSAMRELSEETGYQAKELIYLGPLILSGAYLDEIIYMYYAKEGEFVGQHLDDEEDLKVIPFTLDQLVEKVMNNEITDAKTIAMILKINALKGNLCI